MELLQNTSKWKKVQNKETRFLFYLFLFLKKLSFTLKQNKNVKGINVFNNVLLHSAYAENFLKEVINAFDKFSLLYKTKCEIASIGYLNGEAPTLCGMDFIDLTKT